MKQNNKEIISSRQKKAGALLALLIAGGVAKATAAEIVATILFEPRRGQFGYEYMLDINGDGVVDKTMGIGYDAYGGAITTLSNYLVKGARIVYENEGMREGMGGVSSERLIGLITVDGVYIELSKLLSPYQMGYMPEYLWEKMKREGRWPVR